MDDPHTVRAWTATGFIALGVGGMLVVATIHAMRRELTLALERLDADMAVRARMPTIWRLILGAGFIAVRHTAWAGAVGLFSVLLGLVTLVLPHVYGG